MSTFYKLLFTLNFSFCFIYILVVAFGNAVTYCVEFFYPFSTSWLVHVMNPCEAGWYFWYSSPLWERGWKYMSENWEVDITLILGILKSWVDHGQSVHLENKDSFSNYMVSIYCFRMCRFFLRKEWRQKNLHFPFLLQWFSRTFQFSSR